MIERIIQWSADNKYLVLFVTCFFIMMGVYSVKNIPIDAIPDLTDTQVIVYSEWNVSPDIIEDQVTYPIVTSLLGVANVKDIRGISMFGSSFVYVIFEDDTDLYWARSRVLESLSSISDELPEEVSPRLGPDATGVGWVYQYALKTTNNKYNLADLRSLQDWFIRYQLQSVPGVSEVASFGGYQKQYQVQIDPNALRSYNIGIDKVRTALKQGNNETGARVIEKAGIEYMVRLQGYAKNLEDIENIVVDVSPTGVPIYIKSLGKVVLGPEMRRGAGELNGLGEAVGGIVVMRDGANADTVISDVKEKLSELKKGLPEGVEIVETYNRATLIQNSVDTLMSKISMELLIVGLVILFFLVHLPSAFIPIFTLPTAVITSFIFMDYMNITANIMSLGGIAISIGAMVDASIVLVENCHKKIEEWKNSGEKESLSKILIEASKEVGPASFYSLLVIAVSFLPIFSLEGQEGRLFHPLAYTKTLAMFLASFLSITFAPALLVILIRDFKVKNKKLKSFFELSSVSEENRAITKKLYSLYSKLVDISIDHRKKVVAISVLLIVLTLPIFFKIGSEFMPPLNEGSILYMPTTMPGMSISEAQQLLQKQDEILKSFPEVKSVHGKVGRAETPTDPAPLSMIETVVELHPADQWRMKERWYSFLPDFMYPLFSWLTPATMTWQELIDEMNQKMQFPGVTNAWTMPIKGRIDMLTTGIRTPVGIKISGSDLATIEKIGKNIEAQLRTVSGTRSVFSERITGGYYYNLDFNKRSLARHGLSIEQAHNDVQTALGGMNLTTTVQGRERLSVNLRYARDFREDVNQILLSSPKGYQIPFEDVGTIQISNGPTMIRNENGLLTGYVFVDVTDSDIGGYVDKAKKQLKDLKLPAGYSLSWSGQFQSMERVKEKLKVMLPVTFMLILLLIYLNTKSVVKTSIVLLSIPFSAIGAIWLLYFLDYNMSIAVWVGLIALLGVDAETAIYMLLYLDISYSKHKDKIQKFDDLKLAIHEGAVHRLRPKLMTVITTFFALLPIMFAASHAAGADIMKRMAAPMIGGIFTSFLLELLVYPAIYAIWKERELKL